MFVSVYKVKSEFLLSMQQNKHVATQNKMAQFKNLRGTAMKI